MSDDFVVSDSPAEHSDGSVIAPEIDWLYPCNQTPTRTETRGQLERSIPTLRTAVNLLDIRHGESQMHLEYGILCRVIGCGYVNEDIGDNLVRMCPANCESAYHPDDTYYNKGLLWYRKDVSTVGGLSLYPFLETPDHWLCPKQGCAEINSGLSRLLDLIVAHDNVPEWVGMNGVCTKCKTIIDGETVVFNYYGQLLGRWNLKTVVGGGHWARHAGWHRNNANKTHHKKGSSIPRDHVQRSTELAENWLKNQEMFKAESNELYDA